MDTNTVKVLTEFGNKLDGYVNVLASKAGIAVDHFYPMFVRQQAIEGWIGIGQTTLYVGAACLMIKIAKKAFTRYEEFPNSFGLFVTTGITFLATLALIIGSIQSFNSLAENISKINNPEYFAVKVLVQMIK